MILISAYNETMLKLSQIIVLSSLCMFASMQTLAQVDGVEYDWKLKRDRAGIKVFTSKVPGSAFKATMSVMEVDASPASVAALIGDLKNCKKWIRSCKKAELLHADSPAEKYVYSVTSAPFPLKTRDMVSYVVWKLDAQTGKVSSTGRAMPGYIDKKRGLVRVTHADTNWHLTPLGDGKTRVENYTHIDPNGPIPAFLVNLLLVGVPYNALKGVRNRIKDGAYDDAVLPFN